MPELRWILLALGAAFCLGLWWWEARRGRQAADSRASLGPVDTFTSTSTTVVRDAHPDVEAPRELAPWDAASAGQDRDDSVEQDEDGVPWSESPEPAMSRPGSSRLASSDVHAGFDAPEPDELADPPAPIPPEPLIDIAAVRRSRIESGHADAGFEPVRGHPARIEPTIGDAAAAVGADEQAGDRARRSGDPDVAKADPRADEKIVTVRVAAPPLERFEGRRLVSALRATGLEHGKFSIFHKTAMDGSTLFSVASLVEPGTFDLDALDGRRFPGVSLFAVLRRDQDCGGLVEDMLGTARSLAGSLHGTVQDERGVPLSPQRLADLRADVAAWVRRAGA